MLIGQIVLLLYVLPTLIPAIISSRRLSGYFVAAVVFLGLSWFVGIRSKYREERSQWVAGHTEIALSKGNTFTGYLFLSVALIFLILNFQATTQKWMYQKATITRSNVSTLEQVIEQEVTADLAKHGGKYPFTREFYLKGKRGNIVAIRQPIANADYHKLLLRRYPLGNERIENALKGISCAVAQQYRHGPPK